MTKFVGIFETPGAGGAIGGFSVTGMHGLLGRSVHAVSEDGGVYQLCIQDEPNGSTRLVWVRTNRDGKGSAIATLLPNGKLSVERSDGSYEMIFPPEASK